MMCPKSGLMSEIRTPARNPNSEHDYGFGIRVTCLVWLLTFVSGPSSARPRPLCMADGHHEVSASRAVLGSRGGTPGRAAWPVQPHGEHDRHAHRHHPIRARGLAVASVVGVGEIGMIAGCAAYQVLREGVSPGEAARKIIEEIGGDREGGVIAEGRAIALGDSS
jgi:hypothetical protein